MDDGGGAAIETALAAHRAAGLADIEGAA